LYCRSSLSDTKPGIFKAGKSKLCLYLEKQTNKKQATKKPKQIQTNYYKSEGKLSKDACEIE